MAIQALKIHVQGRVQGVGYRAATQRQAQILGLSGWVRNLPDGSVEAFAQGAPRTLEELVQWCHQGPPSSRVDKVTTESAPVDPSLQSFEIRR